MRILLVVLLLSGPAFAAEAPPVAITGAFQDAIYMPGIYEAAPVTVPLGTNNFGMTLDRTNIPDKATRVNINILQFVDGSWQIMCGAGTIGGILKDPQGNIITATRVGCPRAQPPAVVMPQIVINGTPAQINSSLQMWEVK